MMWKCASYTFDTRMPILMGIQNVTPDSFSDGGLFNEYEKAIQHARQMVAEGAQIIDVGGESTRPGSQAPSIEEEIERTVGVVEALASVGICVSIDTRHVEVAEACVRAGAAIVNDVSGFRDPRMVEFVAKNDVGVVIMHMKGTPETMQSDTHYDDVVADIADYLKKQALMLEVAGISRDRICIDPGPGFGKTAEQTRDVVRNFQEFVHLGYPVMVAVSRKGYIGKFYEIENPLDRDEASAKEALMAVELGASVVRAHSIVDTVTAFKDLRPYALLALGCNVALVADPGEEQQGKIAQMNQAIGSISMLPDTQLIDVASFYESEPAYYEDQDMFVNTVVLIRTGIPPKELLEYLHAIENNLGRVRGIENGPRTCDIDILDYQQYVVDAPELTLPHPRILERDFVVKPLLEIKPGHILADGVLVVSDQIKYGKAKRIPKG